MPTAIVDARWDAMRLCDPRGLCSRCFTENDVRLSDCHMRRRQARTQRHEKGLTFIRV